MGSIPPGAIGALWMEWLNEIGVHEPVGSVRYSWKDCHSRTGCRVTILTLLAIRFEPPSQSKHLVRSFL